MLRTIVALPRSLASPAIARRSVRTFATQLGWDDEATAKMTLIASELVSNAVEHGREPVVLTVFSSESEITVEVSDGDPRVEDVCVYPCDRRAISGRGLNLVACLSDRWGVRQALLGKTIWAAAGLSEAPYEAWARRPLS